MAFLYRSEENEIIITGYEGDAAFLQVPDTMAGLPVRVIGKSAFSRRSDLRGIILPPSLRRLEKFAFYSCVNLEKVIFSGNIADYGDGVFRLCSSLHDIELNLSDGDLTVMREILADIDRVLHFRLHLPQGEACLTFPDYLMEYEEDTFARVIHSSIVGTGFTYRECVSRSGIDFRGYDRAFGRIRLSDFRLAAQIAMNRLLFPLSLEPGAEEEYASFLKSQAEEAVSLAVRSPDAGWLRMLAKRSLLTPRAVDSGILLASQLGRAEYVSVLMNAAPRRESRSIFRL